MTKPKNMPIDEWREKLKAYRRSDAFKAIKKKYNQSQKGKEKQRIYDQKRRSCPIIAEKIRERQRYYCASERGKEIEKIRSQKESRKAWCKQYEKSESRVESKKRRANTQKYKLKTKEYDARPERIAARNEYRNKEESQEKMKMWLKEYKQRPEIKEKIAKAMHKYQKSPKGIANSHKKNSIRRVRACCLDSKELKKIKEWMTKWKSLKVVTCYWCQSKGSTKKYHADHIIPLAKGGLHSLDNLCISCASCNMQKSAKMPSEFVMTLTSPTLL